MNDISAITAILGTIIGVVGTIIFTGPAGAWKVIYRQQNSQWQNAIERIAVLEAENTRRESEVEHRDGVIRRLRHYLTELQHLLHQHGIEVPAPPDDPYREDHHE